jgi:hypothetical protein
MRSLALAAALVALLAPLAPESTSADNRTSGRDFRWAGRLSAGQTLEIYGVNGGIEARSGSEALVTATKTSRRGNPELVEIRAVEHAGGVTVCAIYPNSGGNQCVPGEGVRGSRKKDRNHDHHNDVQVEFTLEVPEGVKVRLHTVNGNVNARELPGDVDVHTVNGSVEVSTSGVARAQTVNGSLTASMGQADWDGTLEMNTVNGTVRVELPAGASTEVRASTVNGHIDSDFPLTLRGKHGPKHAEGTIGGGGRTLEMSTVNGAIELRQR